MKRIFRLLADLSVPLLVIGACVAFYRWVLMTLLESALSPSDALVTLLRRIGVTASLLAGYWAVATYYERRKIPELAVRPLPITISALFGIGWIGITILLLFALDYYQLQSYRGFAAVPPILVVILIGVLFEEVIFRGVVFRTLEKHVGTVRGLVVQALIFGVLHLFNDGSTALTLISVTLLGALWTIIYVHSRNLWVVVANHAAWNATLFLSGLPLSGSADWRMAAPFETTYAGPPWLTGGEFGPEDSIINILLVACAFAGIVLWSRRKGRFSRGSWHRSLPAG